MIFGRHEEIEILSQRKRETRPHFIGLYGRRRVGKTALIRHCFEKSKKYVEITGVKGQSKRTQKTIFIESAQEALKTTFFCNAASSWSNIFKELTGKITRDFTLFLDELPWLAADDSELLSALDYMWNSTWSTVENFRVIICGSASAWMIDKIVRDTGGLHNRLTLSLAIHPLSLKDTELHLRACHITLPRSAIVDLYLVFGGIPYYHKLFEPGLSAAEIIQKLLFRGKAPLIDELHILLQALYRNSELHLKILGALSKKLQGLTRQEISAATRISSGGSLERALEELIACDFVTKYVPFGRNKRGAYFKIADEFTLFYLRWMKHRPSQTTDRNYWQKVSQTPAYAAWSGYSFENVCQKHTSGILKELGLSGILVEVSNWRFVSEAKKDSGAQIDLVLDRADKTITLCEIKYNSSPLALSKAEIAKHLEIQSVFKEQTKTRKFVNSILIAASGVRNEALIRNVFSRVLTIDSLFEGE